MSSLGDRIKALESLGQYFNSFNENDPKYEKLVLAIEKSYQNNGWFRKEECLKAISSWGIALKKEKIENWLAKYELAENKNPKTIALVLAGNIPMVGFHDLIAVWISGNNALVKCASKDKVLIPFIVNNNPIFKEMTTFTNEKLKDFDAVIATGSNNTGRYFNYYFSKYPSVIRKNRNGVGILNGRESNEEMEGLGRDMLQYFGLGCRNISKLYLPKGYDLNQIFGSIYPLKSVIEVHKYANNYDYNKAVFLMSNYDFVENGFLMLKKDEKISSPIGCVYYEEYENLISLQMKLENKKPDIQCIVTNEAIPNKICFGQTQNPALWDYADDIDTIEFLTNL